MFWKKKNTIEFEGLPVTLSKRDVFNRFSGEITKQFLAYKHGNEWRGLVGYEQYKEEQELRDKLSCKIEKKLDLILDHLKLEYVPETEKKEPAKLVEKKEGGIVFGAEWGILGGGFVSDCSYPKTESKKKKRGRPKKK